VIITPEGHALGWRKDIEDRQKLHSTAAKFAFRAPAAPPPVIDHRSWLKVENQGPVGSCAGHAGSSVAEVCNWIKSGGKVRQFSRMWCYLMGQKHCGLFGRDVGASIGGVVEALMQDGVPQESTFPYPGRYVTAIPQAAVTEAAPHKMGSHAVMRSYDDVFAFLASGIGAIEIGIDWTSSLANNTTGVIESVSGGSYGGHALGGYSDRRDRQGRQYIWLVNSHGTGWGNQGWAEVAPDVIDQWIRTSDFEFIGMSDLAAYDENTNRLVDFGDVA
jgi:hypothetical protein